MGLLKRNDVSIEYHYLPKNKLPHRIGFFSEAGAFHSFDDNFCKDMVIPWLKEHIGKGNVDWKHGYTSKKVLGKWCITMKYWVGIEALPDTPFTNVTERKVWGNAFYFRTEEDAAFFRLTWG